MLHRKVHLVSSFCCVELRNVLHRKVHHVLHRKVHLLHRKLLLVAQVSGADIWLRPGFLSRVCGSCRGYAFDPAVTEDPGWEPAGSELMDVDPVDSGLESVYQDRIEF
jgi:hypothetical protein